MMVSTEVKLLYDFQYLVPGGNGEIVFLKAGETFLLLEEKSERWLSVSKFEKEGIFYVPVHYAEQFRRFNNNDADVTKRLTPPRPPYKPKNLLERLKNNQTDEPHSPPPIDETALIELYNIISSENSVKIVNDQQGSTVTEQFDNKQHKFSHGEMFISDQRAQESILKNAFSSRTYSVKDNEVKNVPKTVKEINKKKIPVPKAGEIPLKVFPNDYEMYKDEITGQVYYYNSNTLQSSWILPRIASKPRLSSSTSTPTDPQVAQEKTKSASEDVFSHKPQGIKSGFLNRTKMSENGGKLKKYWAQLFVILEGTQLYFYKEQKLSSNKTKADLVIDLPSSTILRGSMNSKQNLIHVILPSGTEYLLHSDSPDSAEQWFDLIYEASLKEQEVALCEEVALTSEDVSKDKGEIKFSDSLKKKQKQQVPSEQPSSYEKTKLREKLKMWLARRPTQDSLREKGIYKDPVFGSSIFYICKKEGSKVPNFVRDCISTVEQRGLLDDGIYRVSGNLSEIQKLRYSVNQNASYNLVKTDIHVVTGALKLFFRELQEPLFPFDSYFPILDAFDGANKIEEVKYIIDSFPQENHASLKELLRHLLKVVEHSSSNRMHITNLSIVFGPTLLWPKETCNHEDLPVSLMKRGQLIELLLKEFHFIFNEPLSSSA